MNPIASELNEQIKNANPYTWEMLSKVGKELYFPKGILSQSAEAKEKAYKFNATIGMATEKNSTMHLSSIMKMINGLTPDETLGYAPSFGIPALRKKWKEGLYKKNSSLEGKETSLPIVTNAITHGLSVTADMWVDPGDTIILPDMMWGNYNLIFSVRAGAKIVNYPMFDNGGNFNLEEFRACVEAQSQKTKKVIVLLNFPNNPTGYTINNREADGIIDILLKIAGQGTNVLCIIDDAYFGLFYEEDMLKESLFSRLSGKHKRITTIKLDGATKEDFVWGLRVGFITYGVKTDGEHKYIYDALEKKTAGSVRGSISNASRLSQEIVLKSMLSYSYISEKEQKFNIMKERAIEVREVLKDVKYTDAWKSYPFNSGYFMCIKLKNVEAEKLRVHLLDNYGVGLISLGKSDLRIAFSCLEKKDVRDLFDIVLKGVNDLK